MSERTTITVPVEVHQRLRRLARSNGMSVAAAAQTAVEALETLLELHAGTAAKAVEPDVGDLFARVAKLIPAGLVDGKRVEWGRLEDGRPALLVEGWVIAEDLNGDVMLVRDDGGQVGRIHHGRPEVLADRELAVAAVAALN
jgi:hypothetical protein